MANQPAPVRPNWIAGACIGFGIAMGMVVINNGLGFESRLLRILAGAVVGGVVALIALLIANAIMKRRG